MFPTLDSPAFDAGIPGGDRADFATPAGAGDQGRVGCTKTASQLRAMLLDLLRSDELRALAAILFDGQTQKEYAMQVGKSREWVKRRIHRASKKLSTAGVIITLPGRVGEPGNERISSNPRP